MFKVLTEKSCNAVIWWAKYLAITRVHNVRINSACNVGWNPCHLSNPCEFLAIGARCQAKIKRVHTAHVFVNFLFGKPNPYVPEIIQAINPMVGIDRTFALQRKKIAGMSFI